MLTTFLAINIVIYISANKVYVMLCYVMLCFHCSFLPRNCIVSIISTLILRIYIPFISKTMKPSGCIVMAVQRDSSRRKWCQINLRSVPYTSIWAGSHEMKDCMTWLVRRLELIDALDNFTAHWHTQCNLWTKKRNIVPKTL